MTDRVDQLAAWADTVTRGDALRVLLLCAGEPDAAVRALAADAQLEAAVVTGGREAGAQAAERAADAGYDALVVTTAVAPHARAALSGLLTRANAAEVTAPNPDDAAWMDACERVRDAMQAARPLMGEPAALIAALGDEPLATAAGIVLAASRRGLGVILDDSGACVAALAVAREERALSRTWIAGARDGDPATDRALDFLDLVPLLDLGTSRPGVAGITALALIRAAVTACSAGQR